MPLPIAFLLLAIEVLFRMQRLARGERAPREDAAPRLNQKERLAAMSWQIASWLLFGGSTALMLLGLPVAFSFVAINIIGAILFLGGEPGLVQLARNSVNSVANFSLTPIPMFVLMGEVLFHTGLAIKVIEAVERLITKVPGRLAVVAVVAGTIFSAISGSTIAVTAMLGSLMVPLMIKRGYHPIMATGPIIAVGALDMLMPVSALAVLLGSLSGISIPRLLMGGFLPGMILKASFVAYIVVRVKLDPSLAPSSQLAAYRGWEKLKPFVKYVIPILSIFLVVVASMSLGFGPDRIRGGRCTGHSGPGARLWGAHTGEFSRGIARHDGNFRHDLVRHRRGDNVLADFVVFRGQ